MAVDEMSRRSYEDTQDNLAKRVFTLRPCQPRYSRALIAQRQPGEEGRLRYAGKCREVSGLKGGLRELGFSYHRQRDYGRAAKVRIKRTIRRLHGASKRCSCCASIVKRAASRWCGTCDLTGDKLMKPQKIDRKYIPGAGSEGLHKLK